MIKLRLIGDYHIEKNDNSAWDQYIRQAQEADYSIQLGDLSFDYQGLNGLDAVYHRVLGGNHDNYTEEKGEYVKQTRHFLGDYGVYSIPDIGDIFFIRGGRSIDKNYRIMTGMSYFDKEELSYEKFMEALSLYEKTKPDFVISHECPSEIIDPLKERLFGSVNSVIAPSITAQCLQKLFDVHQPKWWVFGHHHHTILLRKGRTLFQCIGSREYKDFVKVDDQIGQLKD